MAHHVIDVTLEPGNYTTPGDATRPPKTIDSEQSERRTVHAAKCLGSFDAQNSCQNPILCKTFPIGF